MLIWSRNQSVIQTICLFVWNFHYKNKSTQEPYTRASHKPSINFPLLPCNLKTSSPTYKDSIAEKTVKENPQMELSIILPPQTPETNGRTGSSNNIRVKGQLQEWQKWNDREHLTWISKAAPGLGELLSPSPGSESWWSLGRSESIYYSQGGLTFRNLFLILLICVFICV